MKRTSLRTTLPDPADEVAAAEAAMQVMQRPAATTDSGRPAMTTSTVHMPVEMLNALRLAAIRRSERRALADTAKGRGGRPSVSEIVVEILSRHRDEIDALD
jgi:hypothetical protein